MPEQYVNRSSALGPDQFNKPNANTIRVDSDTEELTFGTGASGTTEKIVASTTTSLGLTSASPSAGVGYTTGAGGAVTQITSRATGVTLSKITGQITTDTTSLAAEASAKFTVTNTLVAATDVVVVSFSNAVGLNTDVIVTDVAAGSFELTVVNGNVAAGTAETGAILINFAVIKAVAA